jgi:Na+/H+ antiporter NhaD/arsenite permease-like protein
LPLEDFFSVVGVFLVLTPFLGVLCSLALFPLYAPRFWERRMGWVSFLWTCPSFAYLWYMHSFSRAWGVVGTVAFLDFLPFIGLLSTLYVLAGGLKLHINLAATPARNTGILAFFALLSGFFGTTGSAMLGIHPLLLVNKRRLHKTHTVIFFILLVCNISGGFSSVGDPPLFLGFLKGVSFLWPTQNLWWPVCCMTLVLLLIYFLLDLYFFKREPEKVQAPVARRRFHVEGTAQIGLVCLVLATLILTPFLCTTLRFVHQEWVQEGVKLVIFSLVITLSFYITPMDWRRRHRWTLHPLKEVSIIFLAIFITAHPIITLLGQGANGPFASLLAPLNTPDGQPAVMAYFWLTGIFSAFLDNAPTYLIFFGAAGSDPAYLMNEGRTLLSAISLGAVFMGAMTYIGNAPNLMVKHIAEEEYKVPMPSFGRYTLYALCLLLPLFWLMIPYLLPS